MDVERIGPGVSLKGARSYGEMSPQGRKPAETAYLLLGGIRYEHAPEERFLDGRHQVG
jgi:hypothetical protein